MKKRQSIFITAAFVLAMLFLLPGCSKEDKGTPFEKAVKSGEYLEAVEIYNEEYLGNAVKEVECEAFLTSYWNTSWEKYCSGELDDVAFDGIYASLENVCAEIGYLDFNTLGLQYSNVKSSKKDYEAACRYLEEGRSRQRNNTGPEVEARESLLPF